MRVSVVTISFNQAQYLEEALDSVLGQVGVDLEYIVVDPGSTDGSRDIIERYRDRLAHVVLEKDAGPADGLNRGLALATGELFYYLNSDDVVLPGALATAVARFEAEPDLAVVYGAGRIIDEDGRVKRRIVPPRMHPLLYAYGRAFILQQAAVLRTSALRAVGGFNIENRSCWDGEAFLEVALAGGRFGRIFDDLGLFRIHSQSISGAGAGERFRRDHERLFRRVTGRERRGWTDEVCGAALGLASLALDPGLIVRRLADRRRP